MSSIHIFPPLPTAFVLWGLLVLVVVAITFTLASPLSHYPIPSQYNWCASLRLVFQFVNELKYSIDFLIFFKFYSNNMPNMPNMPKLDIEANHKLTAFSFYFLPF